MGLTCSKNGFTIRLTCDLCHGLQMSLYRVSGRWTKSAFESGRNVGSNLIREDVKRVATWTLLAMRRYGWEPMDTTNASPCAVRITFVERDHKRDVGNIHGGAKYALDGLTARHRSTMWAGSTQSQGWP